MVEALRVLLGTLVAASLCTIAAYVVGFVAIVVCTLVGRARPDPLTEDLDQVLGEILGRSEGQPEAGRRRGGQRR